MQVLFALYPLALCAAGLYWVWMSRPAGLAAALLAIVPGICLVAFAVQAGSWAFTSVHLRWVFCAILLLAAIATVRGAMRLPPKPLRRPGLQAGLAVALVALNLWAASSRIPPRETLEVAFPLDRGTYFVMQGGSSAATNSFHAASGTPYALDVTALNAFGNRANGIAPGSLSAYAIYGATVRSPCAGIVVASLDGRPDNPPGQPDTGLANHVVVKCGDVEVFLAHLMKDSVLVAAGTSVKQGQPLGRVGNSGYSMEPHLHIGATRAGAQTGLTFGGRWLSANDSFVAYTP